MIIVYVICLCVKKRLLVVFIVVILFTVANAIVFMISFCDVVWLCLFVLFLVVDCVFCFCCCACCVDLCCDNVLFVSCAAVVNGVSVLCGVVAAVGWSWFLVILIAVTVELVLDEVVLY